MKYNDVPFVPCNDCSNYESCQAEAYEQGKKDAQEECERCVFSGWKEQMEKHDAEVRAAAINNFVINAITEFQKFDKEHGYPTLGDISVILSDVAERLKEQKE